MPTKGSNKNARVARAKEIQTFSDFSVGYRNREDTSLLNPKTLVAGSHDVLTNVSGRVASRKGYTIDGAGSAIQAKTISPFTWQTQTGHIHIMRAAFLTSAANDGKLQFRYVNAAGAVTYYDLLTGLSSTLFNYVNYWDAANVRALLLFVNGSQGIWEWTGAIGTVSTTSGGLTLSGTRTLAQLGFSPTGNILVNGTSIAYTSIAANTFGGITADISTITAGTVVYQAPVFTATSSFTFTVTPTPPADFTLDLISQINNQVFFASLNYNLIWMSKAGDYKNYAQSTARLQYEGDQFTTQGTVKAFIPEDKQLYISAGLDEWYITNFIQTTITNQLTGVTLTYENGQLDRLKTTSDQATQSQAMTTKIKNNIVFVSNEPILNSLGTVQNYLDSPQTVDMSFPIVNDMNEYDFTDGSLLYTRQFVYLGVPREGLFRIYNMTNPSNQYWEAPQMIALGGFSQLPNGQVLGHSYLTSESYILFNGYSDRATDLNTAGNPISCEALFAFQTEGVRSKRKSFNKFFTEGYMNANTIITTGLIMRSPDNGMTTSQTLTINGTANYVLKQPDNSLGKFPFGKSPNGSDINVSMQNTLPSYFAVIKTLPRKPYLAYQPYFSSYGINQQWELLSFGTDASTTTEIETDITV